jgi:hypothetical protein
VICPLCIDPERAFCLSDTLPYRCPATATARTSSTSHARLPSDGDRVLRYPDGAIRTIRYPDVATSSTGQSSFTAAPLADLDPLDSIDDHPGWVICGDRDAGCLVLGDDSDSSLPGAAPVGVLWGDESSPSTSEPLPLHPSTSAPRAQLPSTKAATATAPKNAPQALPALLSDESAASSLPGSPAALLRFLQSDGYRRQQEELTALVLGSFKLLFGSPWVAPRPVHVLEVQRKSQEHASMYTLPTRMPQVCLCRQITPKKHEGCVASVATATCMS